VPKSLVQEISGAVTNVSMSEKTQDKIISLHSYNATIQLNIAYFPAWVITVDNEKIVPSVIHDRYVFPLTNGLHVIDIHFVQTPVEKLANILSLVGFCLLIIGIIKTRKAHSL